MRGGQRGRRLKTSRSDFRIRGTLSYYLSPQQCRVFLRAYFYIDALSNYLWLRGTDENDFVNVFIVQFDLSHMVMTLADMKR